MKKYFSISEAAKSVHTTSETLRHYDRIGLVKPSQKDERTNYRYYSEQDIIRLHTVRALQKMDLPLQAIREVLQYRDLREVVDFLKEAEKRADEKIADLQYSKTKIQAAKADYERKLHIQNPTENAVVQYFPKRVILLSSALDTPTPDTLWDYLKNFYERIEPAQRECFAFEDVAGIYTESGRSRLFAVCVRHGKTDGLKTLPEGNYLCTACTAENKEDKTNELLRFARREYHANPQFVIHQVVISGILQWKYQVQIYLTSDDNDFAADCKSAPTAANRRGKTRCSKTEKRHS